MSKVSLARIMYGTNEDLHAPRSSRAYRRSAVAVPLTANRFAAWEPLSLHELLHRLWSYFARKN
jgi:hypothetical protein